MAAQWFGRTWTVVIEYGSSTAQAEGDDVVIPTDATEGTAVRWVGAAREETTGPDSTAWVRPGDLGTFLGFDGPPGDPEVVVSFPEAITFVTAQENVELVP